MKTNKFFRKAACGVLTAALITAFVPSAIYASAAENATVYSYDGYDVQYSVTQTWTGVGAGDAYDETMAQSFICSGASCALGFHGSVLCAYSDSMLISFFKAL